MKIVDMRCFSGVLKKERCPELRAVMDHVHQNTPAELDLLEFHCNINQTLQARLAFEDTHSLLYFIQ